jgi:hypothetical protein
MEVSSPLRAYQRPQGEPYELLGKRLVFTNWLYVRAGTLGWFDEQGRNIMVTGSAGPWGPVYVRSEFPYGIRITARRANRLGPVIEPEGPAEEPRGYLLGGILQEEGRYRAWLGSGYLESSDGISWQRPRVGQGGTNNLGMSFLSGTVFKDPSAPPGERYKWVGDVEIPEEIYRRYREEHPNGWDWRSNFGTHGRGIGGAVSPDGIHWKRLEQPLVAELSDTQVTGYYDERLRKYVIYTRKHMLGWNTQNAPQGMPFWEVGRRSIGRTESDHFGDFPVSDYIMVPHPGMPPSDLLYTNCRTCIPGAPDLHLMFPAVWHVMDDTTSTMIASSFDGKTWDYVPGGPVLEPPEFGEWDGGCHFASPHLLELPNGDFALPYNGYIFPHKYPRGQWKVAVGYAVWPKGRLIALEAPARGEFTTVAFVPPGRKMKINAVTARAGSILIEVEDLGRGLVPGRSFADSDPVVGDRFRHPVTWKGEEDLGHTENSAVRLRFRMERAAIYALDFE